MKSHEYANLFPMMTDEDIKALAENIKRDGLLDPIITLDGMILDGRNRFKACEISGIQPHFRPYDGADALSYVISHNLHRRHLTESQRAMVAAKWAGLKNGQAGNGRKVASPIGGPTSAPQTETKTRDEAASLLSVGTSSIDRAKKVIKDAPELVEKIEKGEMSVNAAYQSTKETKPTVENDNDPEPLIVDEVTESTTRKIVIREDNGMAIWASAKCQLERISKTDSQREAALKACIEYCQKRISQKK